MSDLTYTDLHQACQAGGASVLPHVCHGSRFLWQGPHAGIAPARYVRGRNNTYAFETRFIDGQAQSVVIVDSKASQLNRIEDAITLAIQEDDPALIKMPSMSVDYGAFLEHDYGVRTHSLMDNIVSGPWTAIPPLTIRSTSPRAMQRQLMPCHCWSSARSASYLGLGTRLGRLIKPGTVPRLLARSLAFSLTRPRTGVIRHPVGPRVRTIWRRVSSYPKVTC